MAAQMEMEHSIGGDSPPAGSIHIDANGITPALLRRANYEESMNVF
jgi:hypothetical protein